jgi:hypothetical protein
MGKILAGIVVAACALALFPTEASAWVCRARSVTGSWGWGASSSLPAARRRALYECAIRTPRRYTCYITSCRR